MTGRWSAALLVLALTAGGCTTDDGGTGESPNASPSGSPSSAEPDSSVGPAADAAAAAYLSDLERYQRAVARVAARTEALAVDDPPSKYRAADSAFVSTLDEAPELGVVEGGAEASESYARVGEVAEHAQGFIDEHEWMARWDVRNYFGLSLDMFGITFDQYKQAYRERGDFERIMAGPGESSVKLKEALQFQVAANLRSLVTVRRRIKGIAGKDSFTPSLRDHLLSEIDRNAALGERYAEYVKTVPAAAIRRQIFTDGFSSGAAMPSDGVAQAPPKRTVDVRNHLANALSRLLAAGRSGQGELPVAGDIYRQLVTGLFVPPSFGNYDERKRRVDEQLYWLWRIREIEDTPDDVFENARQTIKLQNQVRPSIFDYNVDNPFDELSAITAVMGALVYDPEATTANKPWLIELLARPYPDALGEAVVLAREAAELMPDDGSPASPELIEIGPRLTKAMQRAARDLDLTDRHRKLFRTAIAGTRPSSTA
ncbi:hypothetical protein [Nocardioides sp.]|uniref:hypothetical protein n=1 Tax=Nocardioides sp. TaxID=35761 RepID=UPI002C3B7347|nr:hypothetical protein [Nocardioides sp.]HXH80753.1 hypothetical protein [Nocardioides sp.]